MNYSNPRTLALYSAILITVFFSVAYVVIGFFFATVNYLLLAGVGMLLLAVSYGIFRYTLEKFIYQKIRLIYKTIHNLKMTKEEKKTGPIYNTIEEVNRQVLQWGQQQDLEIRRLKELARYRREFLGNVSHELKTPIFNIQGYVLTLLDGGLDDPEINREYLLKTEKSINRMIAIVEDLEAISSLESGELQLEMKVFDIVELVHDVMEFLEIKAKQKNIEIYFARNHDKPVMVLANKKSIRQVLINLIDNSIRYGSEVNGKTKISFFDMDENILVEVTDNGMGIDKESLPRIFERFYRTDKGRSREQGGTGLGLAIVKHIIEAHNQVINVRSKIGVGTTFAFTVRKA